MTKTADTSQIRMEDLALDGSKKSLILGIHTKLQEVYDHPSCPDLLRMTLEGSISWHQRTGISVERVLFSPNLAPQWIAALLALGARVGPAEKDKSEAWLTDFLRRVNPPRSRPSELHLPLDPPGRRWGSSHLRRTPADEPIVSAIAVVDLSKEEVKRSRIALTGVWREYARLVNAAELLIDRPLTDESIQEVVDAVREEVQPQADPHGSIQYRRTMAGVMTQRALWKCKAGAN